MFPHPALYLFYLSLFFPTFNLPFPIYFYSFFLTSSQFCFFIISFSPLNLLFSSFFHHLYVLPLPALFCLCGVPFHWRIICRYLSCTIGNNGPDRTQNFPLVMQYVVLLPFTRDKCFCDSMTILGFSDG